ncbi:MAG TPA: endonuclease/exonuclease/phosphatase family protein [Clostridiales bacterium]|nr:endonuclease/exonuclease/phosphatase family protein [Clostridiales bacterium]
MKIMSFNILCAHWEGRVSMVVDVIKSQSPDSFGLQEAHWDWMQKISEALPEYSYVGVGRDDGDKEGEFSPVFYKKDRFTVVDSGNFWLNEEVTEPGLGWDAACIRICSYALLKDEITEEIYAHFNTHLDHVGREAQINGALLICEKIRELYPDVHTILTGDFNIYPDSECFKIFLDNGLYDVRDMAQESDIIGTWHNFDKNDVSNGDHTIDYILTNNKDAKVASFKVINIRIDGQAPSDHDAVVAEFDEI